MASPQTSTSMPDRALTQLVYELLDALRDTAQLATQIEPGMRWGAHLDYVRDLQRVGREVLAHAEHAAEA